MKDNATIKNSLESQKINWDKNISKLVRVHGIPVVSRVTGILIVLGANIMMLNVTNVKVKICGQGVLIKENMHM